MTLATRPPNLRPGDTIGVAAVSGPVDPEKLDRGIARLRSLGYGIVEASNLRRRHGFLAGTDEERACGYRELVRDAKVRAILFARGGYGASRILDRLEPSELRAHPKIHLGGSDLTALFAYLERQAGLVTFYGPMAALEIPGEEGLDWERVLSGDAPEPHRFRPQDVLVPGLAEGTLRGGCLSLLASLAGTPEAMPGVGTILLWEDVEEEIYRLDRLLTQLERSGTFQGLLGMVIGSVVPDARRDSPETVREYLRGRFGDCHFPVAMGLPTGHLPRPRTIPLGVRVRLDLNEALALSFGSSSVE